jgi:hypothetical protein
MFSILAAFFLAFTVVMVLFVMFLGFLEWRGTRDIEVPKALPSKAKTAS